MNLIVSKENLLQLLYLSSTIVEKRNTMPILANVKISAKGNTLSLSATDLEISLFGESEAQITTPGEITVNAKVFYDIVKELPGDSVKISLGKGQRLEIESNKSHFKIIGSSADEFPNISGVSLKNPISVAADKLYEMLDKVSFAVSSDETRYNINGVYIETLETPIGNDKQGIRFVATDGHRLAIIDRPAEGLMLSGGVIIPRKGIQEVKKVLEGNSGVAYVGLSEGFFTVKSGIVTLGVRLVDGQYPDYRQVIPKETKTKITLNKEDFLSAIRRVSLVTTDKTKTIKFIIKNGVCNMSSSSPEYGEASEELLVKQSGDDIIVGFSARYILDLLNAMSNSEEVIVNLNGDLGPGVFISDKDQNYSCIVMPMRFE